MANLASPIVIIGCGAVGGLVAERLVGKGSPVIGVRRSAHMLPAGAVAWCGDASDPQLYHDIERRWGQPQAVAITATPGLRSGGDHRLDVVAQRIATQWASARLVYTGSTAVYADSGGRWIDEGSALARSTRAQRLLAIEAAVLKGHDALVLRAGALAGLARAARSPRLQSGKIHIRGPQWRSLSWIHEADLADLVVRGLHGELGTGVLNAVADEHPSVASFHRRNAAELGWRVTITDDDTPAPERRIRSNRLKQRLPSDHKWRSWFV